MWRPDRREKVAVTLAAGGRSKLWVLAAERGGSEGFVPRVAEKQAGTETVAKEGFVQR